MSDFWVQLVWNQVHGSQQRCSKLGVEICALCYREKYCLTIAWSLRRANTPYSACCVACREIAHADAALASRVPLRKCRSAPGRHPILGTGRGRGPRLRAGHAAGEAEPDEAGSGQGGVQREEGSSDEIDLH